MRSRSVAVFLWSAVLVLSCMGASCAGVETTNSAVATEAQVTVDGDTSYSDNRGSVPIPEVMPAYSNNRVNVPGFRQSDKEDSSDDSEDDDFEYDDGAGSDETVRQVKSRSICEDRDENCDKLARNGNWCVENIEYMTKNCPLSCGLCEDEGEKEVGGEFRTSQEMYLAEKSDVSCVDVHAQCNYWAKSGECERNAVYMLKDCKKSCNACDATSPEKEEDSSDDEEIAPMQKGEEEDSSDDEVTASMPKEEDVSCKDLDTACARWARRGRCDVEAPYMAENCPLSCNLCVPSPRNVKHTSLEEEEVGDELRTRPGISPPKESDVYLQEEDDNCVDLDIECPRWTRRGRCGTEAIYMAENCPLSCELCVPRIENRTILEEEEDYGYWHKFRTGRDTSTYLNKENDLTCVDEDKDCKLWADRGECKTNSAYMLKGCRKSCNVCEMAFKEEKPYGVEQEAIGEDNLKILDRMVEMKQYMDTVVAVDPKYKRVKDKCRNLDKLCLFWAVLGECERNPTFMTINCSPSCQTCDQIKS